MIFIIAALAPALTTASFGRAPGHGLRRLGRPQLTLVQERWQARKGNSRVSEANNLAEYCNGEDEDELKHKDPVLADWKGYGTYYPGVIAAKHGDGTVDVLYDDGWTEQNVPKGLVRPTDKKQKKKKQRDDAACELAEDVTQLKDQLNAAEKNVAVYLASQRAAATGQVGIPSAEAGAPAPAAAEAGAPAPAAAEAAASAPGIMSDEAAELQRLKDELEAVVQAIAKEMGIIESNDKTLKEFANSTTHKKSKDDLIAEIAERREELRKIRERRHQQELQMAGMGQSNVSLKQIQENIQNMTKDIANIKAKRDQLDKEKRLDEELGAAVDSILAYGGKLEERIEMLVRAKEEADARKKAAEAAAEEAKEAAVEEEAEVAAEEAAEEAAVEAKKADPELESNKRAVAESKAMANAAAAKKSDAEKAALEAEAKLFKAGEKVEEELKGVSKETQALDTGVHPHGDKWWRYRYEHSYVEAALMICISALMLFYVKLFNWLRIEVYEISHVRTTFGTMYTRWLEFTSLQMLACLLVFLSIWLMDHCGAFDLIARHLHSSEFMRLPHSGKQYKQVAFDICVVLIITFLLYFSLMFSVAHWAIQKMQVWAMADREGVSEPRSSSLRAASTVTRSLTFYGSPDEFKVRKEYFLMHMTTNPTILRKLEEPNERGGNLDVNILTERFPFWKYLRMNVRAVIDSLLELSTDLWLGIIITFVVLFLLHRFLHIGYIRVMAFFLVLQLSCLGACMALVHSVNSTVQSQMTDEDAVSGRTSTLQRESTQHHIKSMSKNWHTKHVVVDLLQYTLFFLCYGAGRMICQPWMWKLHFWLVLAATFFTIALAILFMVVIAPLMTAFAASMAMPPFIDTENVAKMEEIIDTLHEDTMTSKDFIEVGTKKAGTFYQK